jgi:hypothetical protein
MRSKLSLRLQTPIASLRVYIRRLILGQCAPTPLKPPITQARVREDALSIEKTKIGPTLNEIFKILHQEMIQFKSSNIFFFNR